MIVKRTICKNGSVCYKITLTERENVEIDRCHEILRRRFEAKGTSYTKEQRERYRWWLQGFLHFEGVECMVTMASNTPLPRAEQATADSTGVNGAPNAENMTADDPRYTQQVKTLLTIAAELDIIARQQCDHCDEYSRNAVTFFTQEDDAHNRLVDRQPVRYTRSDAVKALKYNGFKVPDKHIYRNYIWCFENSDVNGLFDLNSANRGAVNLQLPGWEERLEGHIKLALLRRRQS